MHFSARTIAFNVATVILGGALGLGCGNAAIQDPPSGNGSDLPGNVGDNGGGTAPNGASAGTGAGNGAANGGGAQSGVQVQANGMPAGATDLTNAQYNGQAQNGQGQYPQPMQAQGIPAQSSAYPQQFGQGGAAGRPTRRAAGGRVRRIRLPGNDLAGKLSQWLHEPLSQ